MLYGSDDELVDGLLPFIHAGLEAEDPVTVATSGRNLGLLRDALGAAADRVVFLDNRELYETPARTIARNAKMWDEQHTAGAQRLRVVGEVVFPETHDGQLEWLRYEALINQVLGAWPQWSICPYDRRRLPAWIVDSAARTHRHVREDGQRTYSPRYSEPANLTRQLTPPPPRADTVPAFELCVDPHKIPQARRELVEMARAAGVDEDRAIELAMGLNEIVTNALQYGSNEAVIRCWQDDNRVLCEVIDHGPGLDDPFAGFCPPAPEQLDGRGLWLARQIFDRVELLPGDGAGLCATVEADLDDAR